MFTNTAIKLNSSIQLKKKELLKVADEEAAVCPPLTCCCTVELIALIQEAFSACTSNVKY